jgi:DNA-binding winged helix-turn-helix (wHTH) protein
MRIYERIRNRSDQMDSAFRDLGSKSTGMKLMHLTTPPTRSGQQRSSGRSRWKDEMKVLLADVAGVPVLVRFLFQAIPAEMGRDVRSLLSGRLQKRGGEQSVRPLSLPNETVLRVGSLQLDLVEHSATRGDRPIDLRPREYQLLKYMMQRPGEILTREALLKDVWHYKFVPETNLIDVHMGRLRRKVDGPNDVRMITNVRGAGFVLSATPLAPASPNRMEKTATPPGTSDVRGQVKGHCHDC